MTQEMKPQVRRGIIIGAHEDGRKWTGEGGTRMTRYHKVEKLENEEKRKVKIILCEYASPFDKTAVACATIS